MQSQTFGLDSAPECGICLEDFTSPASLPCGHCFCLACIGEYWRTDRPYQCPLCKAVFPNRPQLNIDHTLQPEDAAVPLKAGEVPCDSCQTKRQAVKSCEQCMASYCAAHLAPHYQRIELERHRLISVVKNLEDSVCRLHGRKLDMFCRSDQSCICATCAQTEHRRHRVLSIKREAQRKKDWLKRTMSKLQQNIHDKKRIVEKIKLCEEDPNQAWMQNKKVIEHLEGEISALEKRNHDLEHLTHTEDDLHFLQAAVMAKVQHING
ncbi:E3 ubiquitin-protein ligase TRIM47-like [Betta splendens]|uniref:E3 ubiquitin-protein ligase TRIM47-like n=1 Tax=Betta splendens TaxID=158456 RepID=A0A6P7LA00_BETSP|nr:E3 ubiquitin-protein ligase TRIM47-like [Betta splendens]XP_028991402.1 E3 ubiquitin-protein ligase TRIM47-like [Betta splendens]XP_028991420.1 E3 ubiquitin-protein ligase TRIM47-like [Betta splendens]